MDIEFLIHLAHLLNGKRHRVLSLFVSIWWKQVWRLKLQPERAYFGFLMIGGDNVEFMVWEDNWGA